MNGKSLANTLTIGGEEVPYTFCLLPQAELKYYSENPRIFSIVHTGEAIPSQEEIERTLQEREHVRQLCQSIKANGGVTDPLYVRDQSFDVLEGNSRLAAIRLLAQQDPLKWGNVKCYLLPSTITEKRIFSFLCQFHIIGRQDWKPYEQAGVIWRRCTHHGASPEEMAKEMGRVRSEIEHLISVYSFMDENQDKDVEHWSYYDEYLKPRIILKRRESYQSLDEVVVKKIKAGEIEKAEHIRDGMKAIARAGGRILNAFIEEKKSFQDCWDMAEVQYEDSALHRMLHKFRVKIGELPTKKALMTLEGGAKNDCKYELKKIRQSVDKLLKVI